MNGYAVLSHPWFIQNKKDPIINSDSNKRIITTEITSSDMGKRLDLWLSGRFTYLSRNQWQNVIKKGEILLNGKPSKGSVKLKAGDKIDFIPNKDEPSVNKNFDVIFEDEWLFAVNKSGNLPCHPAGPFFQNTLWFELTQTGGKNEQIHFINRIDRETSGIVLIAKNPKTAATFAYSQAEPLISLKQYQLLVYGEFPEECCADGFLFSDCNIDHNHRMKVRKKRIFTEEKPECDSETCKTIFRLIKSFYFDTSEGLPNRISLLEADLFTGRMHQIRATLCSLGFPLTGDKLYGPDESIFLRFIKDEMTDFDRASLIMPRQALHSSRIVFRHPYTDKEIDITAPFPDDMKALTTPGRLSDVVRQLCF